MRTTETYGHWTIGYRGLRYGWCVRLRKKSPLHKEEWMGGERTREGLTKWLDGLDAAAAEAKAKREGQGA